MYASPGLWTKKACSNIDKKELKTRSKSPTFIIATKNYTPIK